MQYVFVTDSAADVIGECGDMWSLFVMSGTVVTDAAVCCPCGFWKTGQRRGRVRIQNSSSLRRAPSDRTKPRRQESMHLNIHYTRRTVPCQCAVTQPRAAGARDMRIFLRPYVGPRPMCGRRPCECSRCAHAIGLRGGETVRQCRAFGQTRQARAVSDHFSECLLSSLCSALLSAHTGQLRRVFFHAHAHAQAEAEAERHLRPSRRACSSWASRVGTRSCIRALALGSNAFALSPALLPSAEAREQGTTGSDATHFRSWPCPSSSSVAVALGFRGSCPPSWPGAANAGVGCWLPPSGTRSTTASLCTIALTRTAPNRGYLGARNDGPSAEAQGTSRKDSVVLEPVSLVGEITAVCSGTTPPRDRET